MTAESRTYLILQSRCASCDFGHLLRAALDRKALACSVFTAKMSTRTADDDEFKLVEVGPVLLCKKRISHRLEEEADGTYLLSIH